MNKVLAVKHLGFEHPATGEILEFRAELPADMARLRDVLRSP